MANTYPEIELDSAYLLDIDRYFPAIRTIVSAVS